MDDEQTIPCGRPDGCAAEDFVSRMLELPPGLGARRETTPERDAIARGEKRFNAYGCK